MSISEAAVFKMGHIACAGNIANMQTAKKLPEPLPNFVLSPSEESDDKIKWKWPPKTYKN